MTRVLILGGTGDARRLADLAIAAGFDVISSLAGRTAAPRLPDGTARIGGFGGPVGLATYVRDDHIDLLVDATHPFANKISANAAQAADLASVPRLLVDRPAWEATPGDRWLHATSVQDAAGMLPGLARRVFLTIGRQDLGAFSHLESIWFLYRMIDPPVEGAPRPPGRLLLDRGPFTEQGERDLIREHRLQAIVTRNSGGAHTYPKIVAARSLGLPVIIIDRPPLPPGETVHSPDEALHWLLSHSAVTQ